MLVRIGLPPRIICFPALATSLSLTGAARLYIIVKFIITEHRNSHESVDSLVIDCLHEFAREQFVWLKQFSVSHCVACCHWKVCRLTVVWLKQFNVAHCVACCHWKGCIRWPCYPWTNPSKHDPSIQYLFSAGHRHRQSANIKPILGDVIVGQRNGWCHSWLSSAIQTPSGECLSSATC